MILRRMAFATIRLSRRYRVRFIGKRLAGIVENHGTKREGRKGSTGEKAATGARRREALFY